MPKPKEAVSYRLTPAAKAILHQLSEELGIPKTGVIELAVRSYSLKGVGVTAEKKSQEKIKNS